MADYDADCGSANHMSKVVVMGSKVKEGLEARVREGWKQG